VVSSCQSVEPKRPTCTSVGVGIGYLVDSENEAGSAAPNVATVRLRLPSGLTFEPTFLARYEHLETDTDDDKTLNLGAGVLVRWPLARKERVDLSLVGGARAQFARREDEDGDLTKVTVMSAVWGLGLDYWITSEWVGSMTLVNPLALYVSETADPGPTLSGFNAGLTFAPAVLATVHLYY
jgi:hypothetical protein